MRGLVRMVLAAATSGAIAIGAAVPAGAAPDDQARLDGAIDSFEQRMTDAGWSGAPADDDDDDDGDDSALGDEEFAECLGELATLFEGTASTDEFPGQTALRESLEFTYVPPGEPSAPTTEELSFDFGVEEMIAAFALSVDDANVELIDSFVDQVGAKSTGDCLAEAMNEQLTADTIADELTLDFETHVANAADIGVGDRSARMEFELSTDLFGMPLTISVDLHMARVDRALVMVLHSIFGSGEIAPDDVSDIDPLAELGLIADSLSG
jgi:hypothetical protein